MQRELDEWTESLDEEYVVGHAPARHLSLTWEPYRLVGFTVPIIALDQLIVRFKDMLVHTLDQYYPRCRHPNGGKIYWRCRPKVEVIGRGRARYGRITCRVLLSDKPELPLDEYEAKFPVLYGFTAETPTP